MIGKQHEFSPHVGSKSARRKNGRGGWGQHRCAPGCIVSMSGPQWRAQQKRSWTCGEHMEGHVCMYEHECAWGHANASLVGRRRVRWSAASGGGGANQLSVSERARIRVDRLCCGAASVSEVACVCMYGAAAGSLALVRARCDESLPSTCEAGKGLELRGTCGCVAALALCLGVCRRSSALRGTFNSSTVELEALSCAERGARMCCGCADKCHVATHMAAHRPVVLTANVV